jgi:hypothetical protein
LDKRPAERGIGRLSFLLSAEIANGLLTQISKSAVVFCRKKQSTFTTALFLWHLIDGGNSGCGIWPHTISAKIGMEVTQ